MNTKPLNPGLTDGLDLFPEEIQTALSSMRKNQAPRSLVERITENALALEPTRTDLTPAMVEAGKARMGASRRGLIYALASLALTAFLTFGFFAREKEKAHEQIASTADGLPMLSAIVVLPLLQWDKDQFEQDLKRMEADLTHTAETVQIRSVREEIDQVLAQFKR